MATYGDDYSRMMAQKQAYEAMMKKRQYASSSSLGQYASGTAGSSAGMAQYGSIYSSSTRAMPPNSTMMVGPFTNEQLSEVENVFTIERIEQRMSPGHTGPVWYVQLGPGRQDAKTIDQKSDWQVGYDKGFEDGEKTSA